MWTKWLCISSALSIPCGFWLNLLIVFVPFFSPWINKFCYWKTQSLNNGASRNFERSLLIAKWMDMASYQGRSGRGIHWSKLNSSHSQQKHWRTRFRKWAEIKGSWAVANITSIMPLNSLGWESVILSPVAAAKFSTLSPHPGSYPHMYNFNYPQFLLSIILQDSKSGVEPLNCLNLDHLLPGNESRRGGWCGPCSLFMRR